MQDITDIFKNGPLRKLLKEWKTILPRPRLVDLLKQKVELPPGVSPEQAIEIVAKSEWARKLAEGVCGPGWVGLTPGTPEYESCVYNVSHRVAAKVLGLEWAPPARPPRKPRR